MTTTQFPITDAQKSQYETEGFLLLERVLSTQQLELLREEAQNAIDRIHAQMDALNTDVLDINVRHSRYFSPDACDSQPRLREFLFCDLMAEVCRATIGPNATLVYEQYVIKAAEKGKAFSWHQDSGYAQAAGAAPQPPGCTCWVALDDMSVANGTVFLLPYSRGGGKVLQPHVWDDAAMDYVGYTGDDAGDAVLVPAGSIAVFSSLVFHRSGFNTTDKMRRVYLAQYAGEPLFKADGSGIIGRNDEFLRDGENVAQTGISTP